LLPAYASPAEEAADARDQETAHVTETCQVAKVSHGIFYR
jgi:hypothetical protein